MNLIKMKINLFNMSNNFLRPIDTTYKGYKFRSRLEARWAVFFDALGLKWQYEVEGFNLSNGERYLPDFKVSGTLNITNWYEVKPNGEKGDGKLEQLSRDYYKTLGNVIPEHYFRLLSGDPWDILEKGYLKLEYCLNHGFKSLSLSDYLICPRCASITKLDVYDYGDEIGFVCYPCDFDTPCGGDNPAEKGAIINVRPHKGWLIADGDEFLNYVNAIKRACDAARSARFEFSQTRK
jgi:hypothetical protein